MAAGCWWQAHPFSLSAAPNGRWLRCTVTVVGRYTQALRQLEPGTRVLVTGPAGTSTPTQRTRRRALLIAGGAGIAQARSLLEAMPLGTVVIYRVSSRADAIFDEELAQLSHTRGGRIFYILGRRHDPGPSSAMTAEGLRQLVPDVRRRDVFVCCSEGLTQEVVATLAALRLPRRQLHVETYSL
jgi:ferredoxin-NADP reductase